MRPELVDFHCHLDLYPDLAESIAACDSRRAATLAVTTTPKAFRRNVELAAESEFVRVALGLHPQLVAERASELSLFESLLVETRYVGEVGLDAGPGHYRSFEAQKRVFARVLDLCEAAGDKVLSVHSVRAATPVLDLVERVLPRTRGAVVMHWFSGSVREAERAVALGCYFSVNQRMFASENGRRIVSALPPELLLTETDGPFIKVEREPIKPGDVGQAVNMLAELRGWEPEVTRSQVLSNLHELLA